MPTIPKTQFPIRRVFSYLSISTAKQTRKENGKEKAGIQRQIERLQKFIAARYECRLWEGQFQDLGVTKRGNNRRKVALAPIIDQADKETV